jgi:hypothetical protein
LAKGLGIETDDPPTESASTGEVEAAKVEGVDVGPRAAEPEAPSTADWPPALEEADPPRSRQRSRRPADRPSRSDSSRGDSSRGERSHVEAESHAAPPETKVSTSISGPGDDEADEVELAEEVSRPADPPPQPVAKATSFWESIFGTRQEPAAVSETSAGDAVSEESSTETTRQRREPQRSSRASTSSAEGTSGEERDISEDSEGEDQPRRRRRRRRGRGRSGGSRGDSPESEAKPTEKVGELDDEDDDLDDFANLGGDDDEDDDGVPNDRTGRRPVDADGPTRTRSASGSSAGRSIPTWQDAIGHIVDTNLQTRTERRRTAPRGGSSGGSGSSGGNGGGRGRQRGRRKPRS